MEAINQRKLDHLEIVSGAEGIDRAGGHFDRIRLLHRALPGRSLADVDASTRFLGKRLSFPLLISSMTGGAGEELERINRNLARAAEAEGVALAVGSQRIMFSDSSARKSFSLREEAPTTLLFGNLGAVQLNLGLGLAECREAVDVLGADGLYFHFNPLQEAVQPEGDTDFSNLWKKVAEIVQGLEKPVLAKEVGAGLAPADAELLLAAGVRHIDVAGSGGTSWSRVEGCRSDDPSLGDRFADWGIPTPLALRLLKPYRDRATIIASGGIRSGIDMAKCMVLGASLCGVARPFLAPARESADAVRALIRRFRREFETALFLLGAGSADELKGNEELVLNEDWH